MAFFTRKQDEMERQERPPEVGMTAAAGEAIDPNESMLLINTAPGEQRIGQKEIARAQEILTKYKNGKTNLEKRIVEDELWWELRHWEAIRRDKKDLSPEPTSAWLFNTIINKHADAMDNYPEPIILPRERDDEQSARTLSSVLPVVLERCDFEHTYNDNWYEKLKHGTSCYSVTWNNKLENGLGDIDINAVDLLKLFWEPGVQDIQRSRNLFAVELVDEELLDKAYPEHKGKMGGKTIDVAEYRYDDSIDVSGKALVVDWYYKTTNAAGKQVVHYAKFVGDVLLYASENDPNLRERGFYDHGMYPFVLDVLFPEKGTPCGFGYVAVCKDPQMYIDRLSANIMKSADMATRPRWWVSNNTGIDEREFLDPTKELVHVEGELDDRRIKLMESKDLDSIYLNIMQLKIEELKDTAANRDVNAGSTSSGVTAASAIAALQEAGNKISRDMISASYRAHTEITRLCIELMRQFYDESRAFRVDGTIPGAYDFVDLDNSMLRDQPLPMTAGVDTELLYRRPIFDIKIKAQKKNPFSRMEQNERAKELYAAGFFNPERAQEALGALSMMDFEGIEKVREYAEQGQTLLQVLQQVTAQRDQLAAVLGLGAQQGIQQEQSGSTGAKPAQTTGGNKVADGIMQSQTPQQGYAQRLAARSRPNMDATSDAANPGGN